MKIPVAGIFIIFQTYVRAIETVHVCEHSSHAVSDLQKGNLGCPNGEVLIIQSAIYGRINGGTDCQYNGGCQSSYDLTSDAQEACDGQNSCVFKGTNGHSGDPCGGIHKYTKITYYCLKESPPALDENGYFSISGAVQHSNVNGYYLLYDFNNGKPVYKSVEGDIYLHSDSRNWGNWHIGADIEAGTVFYWAYAQAQIPSGSWKIGGTNPILASTLTIDFNPPMPYPDVILSANNCFRDDSEDALSHKMGISHNDNSADSCIAECAEYQYAGVRDGFECFCGNDLPSTTRLRPRSECNIPCPGNSNENCGGPSTINIYKSRYLVSSGNCYLDRPARILPVHMADFKNFNNKEVCVSACSGYKYAGVQYTFQCFCGNDAPSVSLLRPDHECDHPCGEDPDQSCGGVWRMNIYESD